MCLPGVCQVGSVPFMVFVIVSAQVFGGVLGNAEGTGAALNPLKTEDWRSRGHCNTSSFFSTPILAQVVINELSRGQGATAPVCNALGKGVAFFCLDQCPRQMSVTKIFLGMIWVLPRKNRVCDHPV